MKRTNLLLNICHNRKTINIDDRKSSKSFRSLHCVKCIRVIGDRPIKSNEKIRKISDVKYKTCMFHNVNTVKSYIYSWIPIFVVWRKIAFSSIRKFAG